MNDKFDELSNGLGRDAFHSVANSRERGDGDAVGSAPTSFGVGWTALRPAPLWIKNLFLLPALIAGLALILAARVTAQTFTTLHSFTALNNSTNSDGAYPVAGLILSGNTMYGTANSGGTSGDGTVFGVNTNGTGFTSLHSLSGSDGANPDAGLILSGSTLYGTALNGGSSGKGTVFAVNSDGTSFTTLYSFAFSDGAQPFPGLILSGNTLYGTTYYGGISGFGTLFAVNTDGTGFANPHTFTATSGPYPGTNSDGAYPYGGLILSGNTLYGTASGGGSSGQGTVFKVNTDGAGFTNLYSFTAFSGSLATNSDGATPHVGLILSGNTLYGTAEDGGTFGNGTVFAVNTDGTGFTTLHSFTARNYGTYGTNSDGARPRAGLILSGNTLYGTAFQGGSLGEGTVFAITTDGTAFTTIHNFAAGAYNSLNVYTNSEGVEPLARLILSDNTLYGTANRGGNSGKGTVFSLSLPVPPPRLTIAPDGSGGYFIRFNGVPGSTYRLQRATNVTGPWTTSAPQTASASGLVEFWDLFPPPAQAFYRTVQP